MKLSGVRSVLHGLSNGLRTLAVELPHAHSAVVSVQLNVGSRFESREENGISHFLEHMLYRGTPSYPSAHQLSRAFESHGGTLMASTAVDTGSMNLRFPAENLGSVLRTLSEVYLSPEFDGIDIERGIVHEEILEGLDDDGSNVDADNLIREVVFEGHALGLPITGTLEELESFSVEKLRDHHRKFYTASNAVLAVAGPVDAESALRAVEENFASVPSGAEAQAEGQLPSLGKHLRQVSHSSSQTELRVAFRAPAWNANDEPAMEVLTRVLDDGMSARLYHRVCDQLGLCYDVGAVYETYADGGLLELSAESAHERAPRVLETLLSILERLKDEGPSEEELSIIKRRHRWQFEQMLDSPEDVAEFYALEELTNSGRDPLRRQELVDAVTVSEVRDAAQSWLRQENLGVVTVGSMDKRQRKKVEQLVKKF